MTTKMLRKIMTIDEDKCNGCGGCVLACAEGAIQIVDGKAKLISDRYCDGLGACMGECPQGAITIIEREAEDFDEEAVMRSLAAKKPAAEVVLGACPSAAFAPHGVGHNCPSAAVSQFGRRETSGTATVTAEQRESALSQWPVQLTLVPPTAPFLQGADVLLVAHCAPFAYAGFHQDFLKDHALLIACPKLDDFQAHVAKLTQILREADVKSLTVLHMEVPCCSGLAYMARQAISLSGKDIPFEEVVIGIKGDLKFRR